MGQRNEGDSFVNWCCQMDGGQDRLSAKQKGADTFWVCF
jgi:hypothetical protein